MAILASAVIDRVAATLNDTDNRQWPRSELLEHLSEAQRAAVLLRPEVNPVVTAHRLVPGTQQNIPTDGFVLIDVIRNMGMDGQTPGRAITPTDRAALDQTRPGWHSSPASATTINYFYDIRYRDAFYVYPPQPETPSQIELVYAQTPAAASEATGSDALTIDDIYAPALVHYTIYKALLKDLASAGQGEQRAQFYFDRFVMLLTGRAEEQEADLTIRHETAETARTMT